MTQIDVFLTSEPQAIGPRAATQTELGGEGAELDFDQIWALNSADLGETHADIPDLVDVDVVSPITDLPEDETETGASIDSHLTAQPLDLESTPFGPAPNRSAVDMELIAAPEEEQGSSLQIPRRRNAANPVSMPDPVQPHSADRGAPAELPLAALKGQTRAVAVRARELVENRNQTIPLAPTPGLDHINKQDAPALGVPHAAQLLSSSPANLTPQRAGSLAKSGMLNGTVASVLLGKMRQTRLPVLVPTAPEPQPVIPASQSPLASLAATVTPVLPLPFPSDVVDTPEGQIAVESPIRSAGSAKPASIAQPATAHAPQVIAQITAAIVQTRNGITEIALNPEELGRVRIAMTQAETGMNVMITAERPETADLMRRHLEHLSRDLRDLGYDNPTFSFEDQAGSPDQDQSSDGPSPSVARDSSIETPGSTTTLVALHGGLDLKL